MSIRTAMTALIDTVASAVSAPAKYSALPANAPIRTPAVVARWIATKPGQVSLSRVKMRETEATLYVVLGVARDTVNEDSDAQDIAQSVLDAVDMGTLGGSVSKCEVTNIAPELLQWGDASYYAVGATVVIYEGR